MRDLADKVQPELGTLKGNLSLRQGNFALESGAFEIPLQGVTVVFGQSGCGKSTFLRAISGLEKQTQGRLSFAEEIWQTDGHFLEAQKREVGFVFQDAALFPHLNVKDNLLYGVKRLPRTKQVVDFDGLVKDLELKALLNRSIHHLSGGEKQRVAIARALLMQPKMLCMDEPLSALDWRAKSDIIQLIHKIVSAYNVPVFYITHSPSEVEKLADSVVFMEAGRIERIETLKQALKRADSPLFDDEGVLSVLEGRTVSIDEGVRLIKVGQNPLYICDDNELEAMDVRIKVVAKDVSLALANIPDVSIMNQLPVTVVELINQEMRVLVRLELDDKQQFFAEITQQSARRLKLKEGLGIYALIKSVALA